MQILDNVPLSDYSTMRLGGTARHLVRVASRDEVAAAISWAHEQQLPWIAIGGGSNIFWKDEGFDGLVVVVEIMGYSNVPEGEVDHFVTVGAGENWDSVVSRTVSDGLSGIEALSLIPGSSGGTPIQNVGAYGQEIADTLVSVEAYDAADNTFVTIPVDDCAFGYRTSRFKTFDRGRFVICSLTLRLQAVRPQPPFYRAVEAYFEEHGVTDIMAESIRHAVIAIRSAKLPNPATVANNGSFFANPIVPAGKAAELLADFPNLPHWQQADGSVKIAAAWLIEQVGFKDYHDADTGMATWGMQPLVLVNESARSTHDLLAFKAKVVDAVQIKFGITLEQEPELLPY